jgi:hypothetical protein
MSRLDSTARPRSAKHRQLNLKHGPQPPHEPEVTVSTEAELKAELEIKAENEALKARGRKGVSLKVSEKGGVSVYGLGRFPVTLYQEQWLKLLDLADDIRTFIKENEGHLKKKE